MALKEDSQYDGSQVLPRVFDEERWLLKVLPTNGTDELTINPDGSINVNIVTGGNLSPVYAQEETSLTSPASNTPVFSFTPSQNMTLSVLHLTASTEAIFTVTLNGDAIRMARTSTGTPNVTVDFKLPRTLTTSDTLTVEVTIQRQFNPNTYTTFVALEGNETP